MRRHLWEAMGVSKRQGWCVCIERVTLTLTLTLRPPPIWGNPHVYAVHTGSCTTTRYDQCDDVEAAYTRCAHLPQLRALQAPPSEAVADSSPPPRLCTSPEGTTTTEVDALLQITQSDPDTTVVSLVIVQPIGASTSQVCDHLIADSCERLIAYRPSSDCTHGLYRDYICLRCPTNGIQFLYSSERRFQHLSLDRLSSYTGMDITFATQRELIQRWSASDVAWFILWLLPVWLVLLLPAAADLGQFHPRDRVLGELEAALKQVLLGRVYVPLVYCQLFTACLYLIVAIIGVGLTRVVQRLCMDWYRG